MQHRCCAIGCFLNNSSKAHALVSNFNDSAQLYFAAGIHCLHAKLTAVWIITSVPKWNLRRSEFHYAWSHVNADIMKLPDTEVKLYPEVNSQTGLSSLRVACKRARSVYCVWTSVTVLKYVRDTSLGQFVQK